MPKTSLYKRNGSPYWWLQYSIDNKQKRISTKETIKKDAEVFRDNFENQLKENIGIVDQNKLILQMLLDAVKTDYIINGKSVNRVIASSTHINEYFGVNTLVKNITASSIEDFKLHRIEKGAKNSTVNRDLSTLRRGFNLLKEHGKIITAPKIKVLKENNVRTNFLEYYQYKTLYENLPAHIKPVLEFLFFTGFRKEEVLSMVWDQVDIHNNVITLYVGTTKNRRGRKYYMAPTIKNLISRLWNEHISRNNNNCNYVFVGADGTNRMKDFRKSWATACKKSGLEGLIIHDTRRSFCRLALRFNIPEKVVLEIGGWRSRAVMDRYNITSDRDQKLAAEMYELGINSLPTEAPKEEHTTGIIPNVIYKDGKHHKVFVEHDAVKLGNEEVKIIPDGIITFYNSEEELFKEEPKPIVE